MNAPLVSVVVPTYNRAAYLGETLDSILGQDHPAVEVVVVDDGSTDGTAQVLSTYTDRVRVVRQPNSGQATAVNAGLAATRGEYLVLVSDDDPLLDAALSTLVDVLEARPDVLVAYPDWFIIDPAGTREALITALDYSLLDMLRFHICLPGPCAMFRRRAVELAGGWNPRFRWTADYDFWLRIGLHGPMLRVPEILATWRRHPAGATGSAPRLAMAQEQLGVVREFFARDDLPDEVRAVEAESLSTSYVVASVVALDRATTRGVPRFGIEDRLSPFIDHARSDATPDFAITPGEQLAARLAQLTAEVARLEHALAAQDAHITALRRHLALFTARDVDPGVDPDIDPDQGGADG